MCPCRTTATCKAFQTANKLFTPYKAVAADVIASFCQPYCPLKAHGLDSNCAGGASETHHLNAMVDTFRVAKRSSHVGQIRSSYITDKIKYKMHSSCEIQCFVETRLCELCVDACYCTTELYRIFASPQFVS